MSEFGTGAPAGLCGGRGSADQRSGGRAAGAQPSTHAPPHPPTHLPSRYLRRRRAVHGGEHLCAGVCCRVGRQVVPGHHRAGGRLLAHWCVAPCVCLLACSCSAPARPRCPASAPRSGRPSLPPSVACTAHPLVCRRDWRGGAGARGGHGHRGTGRFHPGAVHRRARGAVRRRVALPGECWQAVGGGGCGWQVLGNPHPPSGGAPLSGAVPDPVHRPTAATSHARRCLPWQAPMTSGPARRRCRRAAASGRCLAGWRLRAAFRAPPAARLLRAVIFLCSPNLCSYLQPSTALPRVVSCASAPVRARAPCKQLLTCPALLARFPGTCYPSQSLLAVWKVYKSIIVESGAQALLRSLQGSGNGRGSGRGGEQHQEHLGREGGCSNRGAAYKRGVAVMRQQAGLQGQAATGRRAGKCSTRSGTRARREWAVGSAVQAPAARRYSCRRHSCRWYRCQRYSTSSRYSA